MNLLNRCRPVAEVGKMLKNRDVAASYILYLSGSCDPDTLILWNIGNTNRRASSPTNTPPTFLRREASTQPFAMYLFTGLCYASVQVESSNSFADIIRLRWDARASTCNVLLSHSIVNHLVKWSLQQGNLRETSVLVVLRPNFYLNGFSGFAGHLMEQ